MEFYFTFSFVIMAVAKLFILMAIGYVLHARRVIDDGFVDALSLILVKIIFPSLIFTKIISHFDPAGYAFWWTLPVIAVCLSFFGMGIGYIMNKAVKADRIKKEFICGCGFQNCAYLPMNLIIFSFAGALADRLLIYMFLFIMGFNLIMWSLVPLFFAGKLGKKFRLSIFMNPPVIATVLSLVWVFCFGKDTFPDVLFEPLKQLGQAAFPIAMITLGAYLSKYKAHDLDREMMKNVSAVCAAKLLILPALLLVLLKYLPIGMDYKFFLFLQGVMPTAVSLVVIGSYTGADNKFLSGTIFYSHLAGVISIPLWFSLFRIVMSG